MPHLELNLAPTAEDMPDMAVALIRAIIAAADMDRDEMTVLLIHGEPAAVIAPYGRDLPLAVRANDGSFTTMVTDPPPADITRQGDRYHLAHLNAHRVIYSRRPPPAEPPAGC